MTGVGVVVELTDALAHQARAHLDARIVTGVHHRLCSV
jgi:hypothetical protein